MGVVDHQEGLQEDHRGVEEMTLEMTLPVCFSAASCCRAKASSVVGSKARIISWLNSAQPVQGARVPLSMAICAWLSQLAAAPSVRVATMSIHLAWG